MSKKSIKQSDLNKAWNKRTTYEKTYSGGKTRSVEKTFLIFCEGQTEKLYFDAFPITNVAVETIEAKRSKTSLVDFVVKKLRQEPEHKDKEIWLVFDMDWNNDNKQKQDFNNAIKTAEAKGYRVAWSNDAFELWFLLHYQNLETAWSRFQIFEKLGEIWNCNYEKIGKSEAFCLSIYDKLPKYRKNDKNLAQSRAQKLYQNFDSIQPSDANPCTTVYELITELSKYILT